MKAGKGWVPMAASCAFLGANHRPSRGGCVKAIQSARGLVRSEQQLRATSDLHRAGWWSKRSPVSSYRWASSSQEEGEPMSSSAYGAVQVNSTTTNGFEVLPLPINGNMLTESTPEWIVGAAASEVAKYDLLDVDAIFSPGNSTSSTVPNLDSGPILESPATPTVRMKSSVTNLIKACVGSGILALPSGVAAIGDVPKALIPSTLLMIGLGVVSGYTFFNLGRLATKSSSSSSVPTSVADLWDEEFQGSNAWMVSLACFLSPLGITLAFTILLGDVFSSLAQMAGVTGILASRQASIIGIALGVLYPLCSLRSLAALSPLSMVGVLGTVGTLCFMTWRALPFSPYIRGVGQLLAKASLPSFGNDGHKSLLQLLASPSVMVLVSMASTAYLVHFSALDFFHGLYGEPSATSNDDETESDAKTGAEPSLSSPPHSQHLRHYAKLSMWGFLATFLVNMVAMSTGFLTFGGNSKGNILNSYSTHDVGASVCRAITALSLIGSYPILFRGMRSSLLDLTHGNRAERTEELTRRTTRRLLGFVAGLSMILHNVGFMVSMTGALTGSAVVYIFPAALYLQSTRRRLENGSLRLTRGLRLERAWNRFLVAMGVFFAGSGTLVTILSQFFPGVL